MSLFVLLLCLIALGACSGVLAGLLGVGGGIVLVPGLLFIFHFAGYDSAALIHVSIGTSLFIIIFTGLSSVRAHWKRGYVNVGIVRDIGAGIVIGCVIGSLLASVLNGETLQLIFAFMLLILAGLMVYDPQKICLPSFMIGRIGKLAAGILIGNFSTLMGIGGGTMSVPYINASGQDMKRSIGSAAALGVVIAIPAALGFIIIGYDAPERPPYSLGYMNMLAAIIILPVSMVFAPLGAYLTHKLNVRILRFLFAGFMVLVAVKLWAAI